jgi:hypothetical protein
MHFAYGATEVPFVFPASICARTMMGLRCFASKKIRGPSASLGMTQKGMQKNKKAEQKSRTKKQSTASRSGKNTSHWRQSACESQPNSSAGQHSTRRINHHELGF